MKFEQFSEGCPAKTAARCDYRTKQWQLCTEPNCAPYHFALRLVDAINDDGDDVRIKTPTNQALHNINMEPGVFEPIPCALETTGPDKPMLAAAMALESLCRHYNDVLPEDLHQDKVEEKIRMLADVVAKGAK